MIKIDLITGFLGSGKTTFIRKYVDYLLSQGLKIGIVENDYGAVNVDMMLLDDLRSEKCELEMIAGGCDNDCHRRRFKTKLIAMAMQGYDRIIVEPSGIYDIDEFFDVLYEEPLDHWYEKGSVISIVDSCLPDELSEASRYLLMSQTSGAGMIVFSKCDGEAGDFPKADAEDSCSVDVGSADGGSVDGGSVVPYYESRAKRIVERLNDMMDEFNCNRTIEDNYICKPYSDYALDDFKKLTECSYRSSDHIKMHIDDEDFFSSVYLMECGISADDIQNKSAVLFNTPEAGNIIRIKGFVKSNDEWLQINVTKKHSEYKASNSGQDVIIVIGENLCEDVIRKILLR